MKVFLKRKKKQQYYFLAVVYESKIKSNINYLPILVPIVIQQYSFKK